MSSARSIIAWGPDGLVIDIECHLSNSLPAIVIVGLGGKAVEESKERIRSAFAHSQLQFPRKRIILNLAPADIPKDSTSLDVGMAASILAASQQIPSLPGPDEAMIGELSLDGSIRPVRGIIGKIIAGRNAGITTYWIPKDNFSQACLIPGVKLYPVADLHELHLILSHKKHVAPQTGQPDIQLTPLANTSDPFSQIVGQARAKRALLIAAAGGHNVFMYGPPGTGKTMLAKAFVSLLPPPTHDEVLEITHLHSLASNNYEQLITQRPLRSPHHSSSHIAIAGGGPQAKPGEITLSHRGVLFLDEMPEFNKLSLESLRQPLEDQVVTIARARQTVRYPADFILIATANPCPCGYYGSSKECICSSAQLLRYQQKLSGPILDRIDLRLEVESVTHEHLLSPKLQTDNGPIGLVAGARERQLKRFGLTRLNARMNNQEVNEHNHLRPEAKILLDRAATALQLSARSYIRTVKVARTIADLEASDTIEIPHISESLQYRSLPSMR
jgi:magnesium chelatase family protein